VSRLRRLHDRGIGVQVWTRPKEFREVLSTHSALRPAQCVTVRDGSGTYPAVKRLSREADRSPLCSADVEHEWSCHSNPTQWGLTKQDIYPLIPRGHATAQMQASHRGGPCSIPNQSAWDFWWPKCHFSEFFGFPPSTSFHQCCIFKTTGWCQRHSTLLASETAQLYLIRFVAVCQSASNRLQQ
jgi:hypothetical protein